MACRAGRGALLAALIAVTAPAAAWATDPPPPPTEVAQQVNLSQASAFGIVDLRPKGAFGGDSVAVDLDGARLPGVPVTATVRIEFLGEQPNGAPWPASKAQEIAAQIHQRLSASKASDGRPFVVDVVATVRTGTDPLVGGTPGYHQIVLVDRPARSDANTVSSEAFGPNGEKSGNWGIHDTQAWAHETGHLLGLPDRYSGRMPEFVAPDGKVYKLPSYSGSLDDQRALDAWWDRVTKQVDALERAHGKGDLRGGVPAGHEHDIMADSRYPTLDTRDVDTLIANAGVHLHADPGDVLLNKDGAQQNLVVGAGLDVYAPKGGKAHRDGLFAYCTDFNRHIPGVESRFDVLGPAAAQSGAYPQYTALAKVAAEIARRQLAPGIGLDGPQGANHAIWVVTEGDDPAGDPDAASILAAAGVTYDKAAFSTSPHFNDPNAGGATTAAVTPTAVLPQVAADRSRPPQIGDPFTLPAPKLHYLSLRSTRIRAGRHRTLTLRSVQDGSATRPLAILLTRRGRPLKHDALLGTLAIPAGPHIHTIRLPRMRAGSYRLALIGPGASSHKLAFKVVGRRRHH